MKQRKPPSEKEFPEIKTPKKAADFSVPASATKNHEKAPADGAFLIPEAEALGLFCVLCKYFSILFRTKCFAIFG